MRLWRLLNVRNPLWRLVGYGTIAGVALGSIYLAYLRPEPLGPNSQLNGPSRGKLGTYTEQLGDARFVLDYMGIEGEASALELQGIQARLEEKAMKWEMTSPKAQKREDTWTLHGPMNIQSYERLDTGVGSLSGRGEILQVGPAMAWEQGVWRGLAPLVWEDMSGEGKGIWELPAGWHRSLDGCFVVEKGPVRWKATGESPLKRMEAEQLKAQLGVKEGTLKGVKAWVQEGELRSARAEMGPEKVEWFEPIDFSRRDGWKGSAKYAFFPRPQEGEKVDRIELAGFQAHRQNPKGGPEGLSSEGVRWTPSGLHMEGQVRWEQFVNGETLTLKAPRVIFREAPGKDLPADLAVGEARAEGHPLLTWADRSLSSTSMVARRTDQTWKLTGPVYAKNKDGAFQAASAHGSKDQWTFEGPIQAHMVGGGKLRGDRALWDKSAWTITGLPATFSNDRARLSGQRVNGQGEEVNFPLGLSGAMSTQDGDLLLKADHGLYLDKKGVARLKGQVDCKSNAWRVQADTIELYLGAGRRLQKVLAKGRVTLSGKLGSGQGEDLELEMKEQGVDANWMARWKGKVHGLAEVSQ